MDTELTETQHGLKRLTGPMLSNFGKEVGISLDGLQKEFDEMITNFEAEKEKLHNFKPLQGTIEEDSSSLQINASPPSPALSGRKRGNTFSAGIRRVTRKLSKRGTSPTVTVQAISPLVNPSKFATSTSSLDQDDVFLSQSDRTSTSH
ncbi:uncharacterized protein LOC143448286 [Clavelina lepadiformis]|uniref:uncharacterized protein LOC143448286 n=1 Tax=Clavelina lepadiformis TaxID=159417 RepID=UPI0040421939